MYNITDKCVKMNTEDFIRRAKSVHTNKYDYSKVVYVSANLKVCIVCPEHGEFWQTPNHHLHGCGCPKCNGKYTTIQDFINEARKIHGDKYDYSKVNYVNSRERVCIICHKHGEFWQTPEKHLYGRGCKLCGEAKRRITLEDFIAKSKVIHNNKYDYTLSEETKYTNIKTCIICPEHGEFWQTYNSHLMGHGCPLCNKSKLEEKVKYILEKENIQFEQEKCFNWLILKSNQRLDFYLPQYNIAIECQGVQHYKPIDFWGGYKAFQERKIADENKFKLCNEHNIKILYFDYNETDEQVKNKIISYINDTTSPKAN